MALTCIGAAAIVLGFAFGWPAPLAWLVALPVGGGMLIACVRIAEGS